MNKKLQPRTCTRCKETKPVTEFYPFIQRGKLFYLSQCRPCQADYQRERRSTVKGRNRYKETQNDYAMKHRSDPILLKKRKAIDAVHIAVARGEVKVPVNCENKVFTTECSGRLEAHHYKGYEEENRLDVIWFCIKHHAEEHRRKRTSGKLIEFISKTL